MKCSACTACALLLSIAAVENAAFIDDAFSLAHLTGFGLLQQVNLCCQRFIPKWGKGSRSTLLSRLEQEEPMPKCGLDSYSCLKQTSSVIYSLQPECPQTLLSTELVWLLDVHRTGNVDQKEMITSTNKRNSNSAQAWNRDDAPINRRVCDHDTATSSRSVLKKNCAMM